MDYGNSTKKNFTSFTAISGDFSYATSYYYDEKGVITGLSIQATKTADNSYVGSMSVADNGQQSVSIASGSDLATHAANFETIVTKIKADVATAISTASSSATAAS
jgi:hypothetical protein